MNVLNKCKMTSSTWWETKPLAVSLPGLDHMLIFRLVTGGQKNWILPQAALIRTSMFIKTGREKFPKRRELAFPEGGSHGPHTGRLC